MVFNAAVLVTCVVVVVAEDSAAVVWLETGEGIVIEEEEVGNFILFTLVN